MSEHGTCSVLYAVRQNEQGTQGYVPQQCADIYPPTSIQTKSLDHLSPKKDEPVHLFWGLA